MNSISLIGRLTADPEIRYTQGGLPVCNFQIAVGRPYKSNKTPDATKAKDETDQDTDFIPIVCWRQRAEFVSRYFQKGQPIWVNVYIKNLSLYLGSTSLFSFVTVSARVRCICFLET